MKTILTAAAASAAILLASCAGNSDKKSDSESIQNMPVITDETVTAVSFEGLIPAADTEGIEYLVDLDGNGNFKMTQTPKGDNAVAQTTNGTYTQETSDGNVTFYQLVSPTDTTYFVVSSDTTIDLVGPDLKPADSGLKYTLTKK